MNTNTYMVELSEQEVKGVGASRWATRNGKAIGFLGVGALLWLIALPLMLQVYITDAGMVEQVAIFLFAACPLIIYAYKLQKGSRMAGEMFLEKVKNGPQ